MSEDKRRPTEAEALAAVRTLIEWAGDDPDREGLLETPKRVAKAYRELFASARFTVEFFREPDSQFAGTFFATTIHMGQVLTLPMILGGAYLVATAKGRRTRIESIAGTESVA